jgi:hypothetical protein
MLASWQDQEYPSRHCHSHPGENPTVKAVDIPSLLKEMMA